MDSERRRQIEQLYHSALSRGPGERAAFLAEACRADLELRREVESLLAQDEAASTRLMSGRAWEHPATLGDSTVTQPVKGTQLGPYRIGAPLGAGGMGQVYKARDTRLGRVVAIKIVHQQFSERFEREARAISSLNHPHICTLYDIGPNYLVMELVEGEALSAHLSKGPLPLTEALRFAAEIAEALEAAHEQGVIHRDLKPGNIMVTKSGVKVLDFGLAKFVGTSEAALHVAESLTATQVVVGTPAYMSPEQLGGQEVDTRTDLFSFGAVFYEMVTGQRAFPKHMDRTPPPPVRTRPELRRIISKLLDADRGSRYQTATQVLKDLEPLQRPVQKRAWLIAAAALVTIAVVGATAVYLRPNRPASQDQWVQLTKLPDSVSQPALSPDGRLITFVRGPSTFYGSGQIYVKMLPDGEPKQLTRDDFLKMSPVFSPDGSRIAYTTVDNQFKWDTWTVPVLGGEPRRWLGNAGGLVWRDAHTVLFSELRTGVHMALVTSEESRAKQRDVYNPAKENGMAHRSYPSPDGKWALVAEMDGPWLPCRLVPMDGSSPGRSVGPQQAACTFAAWSPDGKWMYFSSSAGGTFHTWRQRFPDGVPEQLTLGPNEEEGIAMAADGRSFVTAVGQRQRSVILHDSRAERQISLEGYAYTPRFALSGKALCYRILRGAQPSSDPTELWIADLESGRSEALLPGFSLVGAQPYAISRDGQQVVVAARNREGQDHLWLATVDRRSPPRQIPNAEGNWPEFGPKGEIVFRGTDGYAHVVNEDGSGLRKLVDAPVSELHNVSPDGQWLLTWSSDPVSPNKEGAGGLLAYPLGGGIPRRIFGTDSPSSWSPDGRLFFLSYSAGGMTAGGRGNAYVFPLPRGRMFPEIPPGGFRSEEEMAKIPRVRVIQAADVAPGPTPDVYAFSRETTQRNLYRIPIP